MGRSALTGLSDVMKTAKSQICVVMGVLREFLQARGLRYRDIAQALDVTERTVMRWFASEAVDTKVIERLCSLIDISFFELFEFAARRVDSRLTTLTVEQEQALVDNALMNYLFVHILKGWFPKELQREVNIPEPMLVESLIQLEKWGLIELLPGNEIRLRTTRDIQWRKDGPYSRYMNMFLRWCLKQPDVTEARSSWTFETLKLSSGSLAQLRRKFETLKEDAIALSDQDRRSNDTSRDWYAVIFAARPIAFTPMSEWPCHCNGTGLARRDGVRTSYAGRSQGEDRLPMSRARQHISNTSP
jgi:transcriptional regulator with XRE-family HTH domain